MSKKLNQKEFIAYMAKNAGITKVEARKEFFNVMNALLDATADEFELRLTGMLSTEIRDVEEREYPNPQDRSKTVMKEAHKKLVIKAKKRFQDAVNGIEFGEDIDEKVDELEDENED